MNPEFPENSEDDQGSEEAFPSSKLLVKLYLSGALICVFFGAILPLDTVQTSFCLTIGWLLISGALGIGVFSSTSMDEEESDF